MRLSSAVELHAGSTAADDGDVDIYPSAKATHHVRTQSSTESVSLVRTVDEVAVFNDPRRAKIVGAAAEGQDQHVVVQFAAAGDHLAGSLQRRQANAPGSAVDVVELSWHVLEMMFARVSHKLHLLLVNVPSAGREGVQHRFPDVHPTAVDQSDTSEVATAQRTPQPGSQS